MAKIIDGDDLNVGTEITIDTNAKTFTLHEAGNLIAKDGVTLQALYSKFIKLWETATYNKYPFPMYAIDALSGQFQFGTDGITYNGWAPANDTTRQMLRDGGWTEYSNTGAINRVYVGIIALASGAPAGAQFYYQKEIGGVANNFTFTDAPNEGIRVDDTTQTYFKLFCREYQYTYDDATLTDVGLSSTGAFKVLLPIAVNTDLKIQASDAVVSSNAPYTSMSLTYFNTDQTGYDIGPYPFRIVIDNTTALGTLEEIYTYAQYKLRQAGDIDDGSGTVVGKTANQLMYFVGDTLYTTQGVFINGVLPADMNRVVFLDQNNVERTYPYVAAGTLNFNSYLTSGGTGYYRMYFTNDDAGDNTGRDYGTADAITVVDAGNNQIAGTITSAVIPFSYDYDANVQRGAASAGVDAPVTVVAGNKGVAKPVVAVGVITRSKGISISLVAEQDRAYTP